MKMSNTEYGKLVQSMAKPSPMGKDLLWAFVVGGSICALGQFFIYCYQKLGLDQTLSSTAATVTLIFLSVLMTDLDLYCHIAKFAGAGTLVPVTGFANSIASPAVEFKSEGLVAAGGMACKMFTIAGPVLVWGISASVVYGLILVVFQLV